jgi:hypothetical protein
VRVGASLARFFWRAIQGRCNEGLRSAFETGSRGHISSIESAVNFDYRGFDTLGLLLCTVSGATVYWHLPLFVTWTGP